MDYEINETISGSFDRNSPFHSVPSSAPREAVAVPLAPNSFPYPDARKEVEVERDRFVTVAGSRGVPAAAEQLHGASAALSE